MSNTIINIDALCEMMRPISGTYEQLETIGQANGLQVGKDYVLTDHEARYFDPVTGDYVISAIEPFILTAVSTSQFSIIAKSTLHPTDYIEFDFSVNTVTDGITTEPAKGLVTLRKDVDQNQLFYDFRNITFDGLNTFNSIAFNNRFISGVETSLILGQELPNTVFNSICAINDNVIAFNCTFGGVVLGNNNCRFGGVVTSENITTNVNCSLMDTNIGLDNSSNIDIELVDINNCPSILECGGVARSFGMKNISIVSDGTPFQGNIFECLLQNLLNDIDIADYPQLFDGNIICYIFRSNGNFHYRYYDVTNTLQFVTLI